MKHRLVMFIFSMAFVLPGIAQIPVKFDSLYKPIYAKELCKLYSSNPDIVFVDVRTKGEYSDTSSWNSLNLGRLKGAVHIQNDSILKHPELMDKYRDKTIVLYCSHSQRSRGVSKLLSEKGFKDFYNLNGGMSSLTQLTEAEFPCKKTLIESNTSYKNISQVDAVKMIETDKNLVVLDVRPSFVFNSKDTDIDNNIGRIRGAINIPYAQLSGKVTELQAYRSRPILVYAGGGDGDAARACALLVTNQFANVYHLLEGLDPLIAARENLKFIENPLPFQLVNGKRAFTILKSTPGLVIYDARPLAEFENRAEPVYRNLGRVKNAVHVDPKNMNEAQLPSNKNAPILVYGSGHDYSLARQLSERGYKKVYALDGLYGLISTAFNVEGYRDGKQFLVNHEGIY